MARQEAFDVELDGTSVRCRLDFPVEDPKGDAPARPVVLLCEGLPANARARELPGQIADALVDAGVAVATIVRGSDAAAGALLAVEAIDDAAAVFHGLMLREDVDLRRVGILGHSVGCVVAACLARRTDQIAGLCLLAPCTAAHVAACAAEDADSEIASRMGAPEMLPEYFEGLDALHPVQDVAVYDRPTLIVHGAADRVAPLAIALEYRQSIEAAGHQVEFIQVALADHFFSSNPARSACLDELTGFFSSGRTQSAPAPS